MRRSNPKRTDLRLRVRPHWRTRYRSCARFAVVVLFVVLGFIAMRAAGFMAGSWFLALTLLPLLALAAISLTSLNAIEGQFVARHGAVRFMMPDRAPVPCTGWLTLPGLIGFRDKVGTRYWVFRDEMTPDHWRRLCLIARFTRQYGVGRSR